MSIFNIYIAEKYLKGEKILWKLNYQLGTIKVRYHKLYKNQMICIYECYMQ